MRRKFMPGLSLNLTIPRPVLARALASVLVVALAAGAARAEIKPDQVLVVVNDSSTISTAIGAYYSSIRNIPAQNIFHLPAGTPTSEYISRSDYNIKIRDVIKTYLQTTVPALKTQIKCILLTKEVPLVVANTTGSGTMQSIASVDSELTQLFTGLVGDNGHEGWITNPFFGQTKGIDEFTNASLSYLVCRLDGYADQIDAGTGVPLDIKNLIDRAQTPASGGFWLLDGDPTKSGGYAIGETWMNTATTSLTQMGLSVIHDTTTTFKKNVNNILGYASWGSNDSNNLGAPYYGINFNGTGDNVPGTFLPGSLATDYVSTSARTFAWPPSYGQSMIADLIRMGCTAANGHVAEPYLNAVSEPDQLFPNYARGMTVAEAFYTSILFLSWENTIICDPLMKKMQVNSQFTGVLNNQGPQAGNTIVTINGKYFSTLGDTAVKVGGVPAQVTSVTSTSITFKTPPAAGPGPKIINVVNSSGSYNLSTLFYYTPALVSPTVNVTLNQHWQFTIYGQHFGDAWDLLDGTLATAPFNLPPYGDFWLDLNLPIAELLLGQMTIGQKLQNNVITVPNDPLLIGSQHDLQAIVGGGVGFPNEFFFTNTIHVNVQ